MLQVIRIHFLMLKFLILTEHFPLRYVTFGGLISASFCLCSRRLLYKGNQCSLVESRDISICISRMFVLTSGSLLLTFVSLDDTFILAYLCWSNALIVLAFNSVKVGAWVEEWRKGAGLTEHQAWAAELLATINLS